MKKSVKQRLFLIYEPLHPCDVLEHKAKSLVAKVNAYTDDELWLRFEVLKVFKVPAPKDYQKAILDNRRHAPHN